MFYQTQISKLITGGIIDTNGKQLRFCGNLPVSEGDWVWTDGSVVFGHVPIRDTPNLPQIEGGIPAAFADDKGYFSKTGNFSKYSIAVDETSPRWIVNGKRKYFHSDTRVFDAEIAIDENGVEDGLFTAELDGINGGNAGIYFEQDGTCLDDDAVVIKKDDTEISRVYLHDYIHAINKAKEISKRGPVDYVEKFVGHSQLLNFRLHTDGSWDAIIASFAYAKVHYLSYAYPTTPVELKWRVSINSPIDYYHDWIIQLEREDSPEERVQRLHDKLANIGIDIPVEDLSAYGYASAVENLYHLFHEPFWVKGESYDFGEIQGINPPNEKRVARNISTYYLIHANSAGNIKILHADVQATPIKLYQGTATLELIGECRSMGEKSASTQIGDVHEGDVCVGTLTRIEITTIFLVPLETIIIPAKWYRPHATNTVTWEDAAISISNYQPSWQYPLQDEYWCEMDEWKILAIFDKDNNPIVRTFKDSAEPFSWSHQIERWLYDPKFGERQRFFEDSITPFSAFQTKNVVLGVFVRSTFYDRSGCLPRGENCTYLSGYGYVTGATGWLFLPAVVKLKNGGYLIGIPQHGIYKVDKDGVAELISDKDELANLRLRYMPNLSKTRR